MRAAVRPIWTAAVGHFAAAAGRATRTVPGIGGALLVCYGLGLAWEPLGYVAAGAFLLFVDWRTR